MPETTSPAGPAAAPAPKAAPARAPAAPGPKTAVSAATFQNARRGQHFGNDAADKTKDGADNELENVQVEASDEGETASGETSEAEAETELEAGQVEDAAEEETEGEAPAESPYPAEIHGVPLADVLAALQEGRLPDELMRQIKLELIDGDDREEGTIADLRDGAMMHRNFTRKSMALAQERKEAAASKAQNDAEQQEFYGMVRSWKDPEAFMRGAKSLELPLEAIAIKWAEEFERKSQMTPAQLKAEEAFEAREREVEKRSRELRAQERKLKEMDNAAKNAEEEKAFQQFRSFIGGHMPDAFAAVGISLEATTPEQKKIKELILARFQETLGVYWPKDSQPTKEMVHHAARATAELLGIKKPALAPGAPVVKGAPVVAKVLSNKPAPKALAGTASYDPGKASSPARKQLSARGFTSQLGQVRRSGPAR